MEQQRDASVVPPDQQSTILNVSVAAQHPRYAMTALALGEQQIWVNYLDRPVGEATRIRIRASDVSLVLEPPQQTSIRNVCRPRWCSVLKHTDRLKCS